MEKITLRYFVCLMLLFVACKPYDIIITNGEVYDGSGKKSVSVDIGIKKDKIKTIGELGGQKAKLTIDATGKVVSPGFINNLSWAAYPLLQDGRSMSDIKQGVTLEVFGEGSSPGPYNPAKTDTKRVTFGQNMEYLEKKGVSTNIASFIGATTLRVHQVGEDNRPPTDEEMETMKQLVRQSMEEGALGIGSSLIYPPAFFASTQELIELCKAAGEYNGMYISHMRSEGDKLEEAVEELITIAKEAGVDAEIYHLKAAGERNWQKLDNVIARIDKAQKSGLNITANMYNYTGASTGLDACLPPWSQDGGKAALMERLKNSETKAAIIKEMNQDKNEWENFLQLAGDPANILLLGFDQDSLNYLNGTNLGEVAKKRGIEPAEAVVDLIVANDGDISSAYFLMSEENVQKQLKLPYISFCSDARSVASEGRILESMTHPRTYGNFARLLGKYVREEQVIPMEEAIHKLSGLPAQKLKINNRGLLKEGYYADIVIFDPNNITDKATFTAPHQYAEGVTYVLVNGQLVINEGVHTGKTPGRFVKGPGFKK